MLASDVSPAPASVPVSSVTVSVSEVVDLDSSVTDSGIGPNDLVVMAVGAVVSDYHQY
jgi:hypothetical protein